MKFHNVAVRFGEQVAVEAIQWSIQPGEAWAVLGTNACGKSTLGRLIAGEIEPSEGNIDERPASVQWLSLESQQALYERELYRDDTDFMDHLDDGTPILKLLQESSTNEDLCLSVAKQLNIEHLLSRGYRALSTGEGRRVLFAQALLAKPDLLILDEPFEGLDADSRNDMHVLINQLIATEVGVLLLVNQQADVCTGVSHITLMDRGQFVYCGDKPDELESAWRHLSHLTTSDIALPPRQSEFQLQHWPAEKPLVDLKAGFVQYDETYQFKNFDWTLFPGQHTQVRGPNGCGKSTLLGLITGDHPQCYRNDLEVLGFKRGSGESIWQIKKHLGYVSGTLHRDYRVSGNTLTALVSGLMDSIGVYQAVGKSESELGMQWLSLIGLADKWNVSFKQLSMGEQRLVLIARALIKQPPLLILDEPTQGLDDFNRFYVLAVVEKIIEHGESTLLFVSHRSDETLATVQSELHFAPTNEQNCLFNIQSTTVC